MDLKFTMDSMEGVAADVASLYTQQEGGKYVLTGIDGVASKVKVDEFRNNNITLTNQLKAFEGIDPAAVKSMESELAEARIQIEKNAGKLDEEAVNKIVEQRVKTINETAATEKARLEGVIETQSKQLETLIIDGNVTKHAIENKVLDSAVTDVMLRAKTVFKVEGGKPVAYDADGNKMYAADGTTELGISDWIKGLVKTSPHLFEASVSAHLKDGSGRTYSGDPSKLSPLQKISGGLGR